MTEAVQLAIVNQIAPCIIAATGFVVVWRKLSKVEKQTNGNLSEAKTRVEIAENRIPGITTVNGPKEPRTLILNDPTIPSPPIIITPEKGDSVP